MLFAHPAENTLISRLASSRAGTRQRPPASPAVVSLRSLEKEPDSRGWKPPPPPAPSHLCSPENLTQHISRHNGEDTSRHRVFAGGRVFGVV